MTYITITDYEKREWFRMAEAAYASGREEIGHRYNRASCIPRGQPVPVPQYDALQGPYRAWLCRNEYPAA